jgi:hypothetical protein
MSSEYLISIDVAMDTCSNCSDEETEFIEDSIPTE